MSLDAELVKKIKTLCAGGYRLYDKGDYKAALRQFYTALMSIPKPHTQHAEAGWVLTAIGDSYFRTKQWDQGREALASALQCPGVQGNPFVHLRLGQCLLEMQRKAVACEHLELAYLNGGRKFFRSEAPKYLMAAMEQIVNDPAG
jgi:tetratricopeptide (TPR) repeat protein